MQRSGDNVTTPRGRGERYSTPGRGPAAPVRVDLVAVSQLGNPVTDFGAVLLSRSRAPGPLGHRGAGLQRRSRARGSGSVPAPRPHPAGPPPGGQERLPPPGGARRHRRATVPARGANSSPPEKFPGPASARGPGRGAGAAVHSQEQASGRAPRAPARLELGSREAPGGGGRAPGEGRGPGAAARAQASLRPAARAGGAGRAGRARSFPRLRLLLPFQEAPC